MEASKIEDIVNGINYESFLRMNLNLGTHRAYFEITKVEDLGEFIRLGYVLGTEEVLITIKKDQITKEGDTFIVNTPAPIPETGTSRLEISPKS